MFCLKINDLNKSYGRKKVLHNINITIPKGMITGIVGPNGSGKTTLLKCLLGLVKYEGNVVFENNKSLECLIKDIGILIEFPQFIKNFTGKNNIDYFTYEKNYLNLNVNYYNELINLFNMQEHINKKVRTYSLGTKQKLALIMSFIKGKKLIVLDEPFNSLDADMVIQTRNCLQSLKEKGITTIITSHNLEQLDRLCDKIFFIENGKIIKDYAKRVIKDSLYEIIFENEEDSKKCYKLLLNKNEIYINENIIQILLKEDQKIQDVLKEVSNLCIKSINKKEENLEKVYLDTFKGTKC